MPQVQERRLRDVQTLTAHLEQVKKQVGTTMNDFHDLSRSMESLAEAFFGLSVLDCDSKALQSASNAFLKEVRDINQGPVLTAFREAVQNNVQGRLHAVEEEAAIVETAAVEALDAYATLEKKRQRAEREAAKLARFSSQHAAESASRIAANGGGTNTRLGSARRQSSTGILTSVLSRGCGDGSLYNLPNWDSSRKGSTLQDPSKRRPNSSSRRTADDVLGTPESRDVSATDALRSAAADVEIQRKNYDDSVRKCTRLFDILRDTNSTESRDALKIFTDECGGYLRKLVAILDRASSVLSAASSYPEERCETADVALTPHPPSVGSAGDQNYLQSLYEREAASAMTDRTPHASQAPHGAGTTSAPIDSVEKPYRPYWTVQPRRTTAAPPENGAESLGGAAVEEVDATAGRSQVSGIVLASIMVPVESQPSPTRLSPGFMPPDTVVHDDHHAASAVFPEAPASSAPDDEPLQATAPAPSVSAGNRHLHDTTDSVASVAAPSAFSPGTAAPSEGHGGHVQNCSSGYHSRGSGSARYVGGMMYSHQMRLTMFPAFATGSVGHRPGVTPVPPGGDHAHRSSSSSYRVAQRGPAEAVRESLALRASKSAPFFPPLRVSATRPLEAPQPSPAPTTPQDVHLPPVTTSSCDAPTVDVGAEAEQGSVSPAPPATVHGDALQTEGQEPWRLGSMHSNSSFSFSALPYVNDQAPLFGLGHPSSRVDLARRTESGVGHSGYSLLFTTELEGVEDLALMSPTVQLSTARTRFFMPSLQPSLSKASAGSGGARRGGSVRDGSPPQDSATTTTEDANPVMGVVEGLLNSQLRPELPSPRIDASDGSGPAEESNAPDVATDADGAAGKVAADPDGTPVEPSAPPDAAHIVPSNDLHGA